VIYAEPSASVEAVVNWGTTGLTGTLGVTILDNIGGTTTGRSTAGIVEIATGVYAATITAPSTVGQYTILWDDTSSYVPDDLTVTTATTTPAVVVTIPTTDSGLTYGDILDAVLDGRFESDSTIRNQAGRLVNKRYAQLVALEDWTFRYTTAAVTVTANSRAVTNLPDDLQAVHGLYDDTGIPMNYLAPQAFYDNFQGDTGTGAASYYTVDNGAVFVGPTPSTSASTWLLLYRRKALPLSSDGDTPIVPLEHRYILVHGGRADLLLLNQDASWLDEEQAWQAGVEAMRRDYLSDAVGEFAMWPADPTWG